MIDNLEQVDRLLCKLEASLPVPALAAPDLVASLAEHSSGTEISPHCRITKVHYLGDEGGIVCHLDLDGETGSRAFIVSITHLMFDPRLPLAREIARYQKHRVKRLRRDHAAVRAAFN